MYRDLDISEDYQIGMYHKTMIWNIFYYAFAINFQLIFNNNDSTHNLFNRHNENVAQFVAFLQYMLSERTSVPRIVVA
jgi:uncharacterized protein (UPF0147 family)